MTSGLPQLTPQLCQQLLAAAQESHPREACGLLTCGADRELAWVQVQNRAKGDQEFEMAAEDIVRALGGAEWIGTWHSHPHGDWHPSPADGSAAWEESLCLILGLGGEHPSIGLWRRSDGVFELLERKELPPARAADA